MINPLRWIREQWHRDTPRAYIELQVGQTVVFAQHGELRLVNISTTSQENGVRVALTFETVPDSVIRIVEPGRRGIVSPL